MNNLKPITERTEEFAIRIIKALAAIATRRQPPSLLASGTFLSGQSDVSRTLSRQLLRSGTSIGANCHESRSAQSHKDFINKLEIALKEARETEYWIKILIKSELVAEAKFNPLLDECQEIVRILIASTKTLKQN